MEAREFTPALGHAALTPLYDAAIALMTREGRWRGALVRQIAPNSDDVILDVGCGTGSLALRIKRAAPQATVIGIDPDGEILRRARGKARHAGVAIDFEQEYANAAGRFVGRDITKIVSSLVLHQVPMTEKRAGLKAMYAALRPGGEIHIADYGLQRTPLMRSLFRQVQRLDGYENTTPNAEGVLPALLGEAGFQDVVEKALIPTPTGSISLYFGRRPVAAAETVAP